MVILHKHWEIFFRHILDSFETLHTPSCQSIPPLVYENTTGTYNIRQFWRNVKTSLTSNLAPLWFQGPNGYLDEERTIKHHLLQLQRSFAGQLAWKHGPSWAFGEFFLWPNFTLQYFRLTLYPVLAWEPSFQRYSTQWTQQKPTCRRPWVENFRASSVYSATCWGSAAPGGCSGGCMWTTRAPSCPGES